MQTNYEKMSAALGEFIPDYVGVYDGVTWLSFQGPADHCQLWDMFDSMPKILQMGTKRFKRMSHNSDTGMIHYKEVDPGMIAFSPAF